MKIKRQNATNFEYLSEGTVFRYLEIEEDNSLYMRIKDIEVNDNYIINAIALEDGEPMCFADCATVIVINGEFVTNE